MKSSKKVLVLFSGGLDSTYLVYKNLKEGNQVIPIYTEIMNNTKKVYAEKTQIDRIYNLLYEEFSGYLHPIYFPNRFEITGSGGNVSVLPQVPAWIFGIIYSGQLQNVDEVQIGYVMNDDAISYLDDIKAIYHSYQNMVPIKLPELVFPLTKTKKYEIDEKLPEKYRELTISCEYPTIAYNQGIKFYDCGDCEPCKRSIRLRLSPRHMKYMSPPTVESSETANVSG